MLKFRKDKKNWVRWLFEAKKRFGLRILNFTVTSNHIHLLVVDTHQGVIPKSIQLLAGRTGREYNLRKKRKGAFWEDRYHATAVQDGHHLLKCLIYIDMNMIRAGVVNHPSEWEYCGYNEIINPPQRYTLIDYNGLVSFCGYKDDEQFRLHYKTLVDDEVKKNDSKRQSYWSESIAVGDEAFIGAMDISFGVLAQGRAIQADNETFMIREESSSYNAAFIGKKHNLSFKNGYLWQVFT